MPDFSVSEVKLAYSSKPGVYEQDAKYKKYPQIHNEGIQNNLQNPNYKRYGLIIFIVPLINWILFK